MNDTQTEFRPTQRTVATVFSSLAVRTAVAVAGIPLMIAAAYFGSWWLLALVLALSVIGQIEFYAMVRAKGYQAQTGWGLAVGVAVVLAVSWGGLMFWGLAVALLLAAFCAQVIAPRRDHPVIALSATVFGVVYVPLLLAHMVLLRNISDLLGAKLLVLTFALVWICDTAAYFTGMTLGRHPLAPAISPKKSVEGLAGGLLVTVG